MCFHDLQYCKISQIIDTSDPILQFLNSFSSCKLQKKFQNVMFEFFKFGSFHQFCTFKTDLSGNTVWPQASGFKKIAKIDRFGIFN